MDLEHARLVLRGEHGLAVDRGRIVREAVAVVLADLESRRRERFWYERCAAASPALGPLARASPGPRPGQAR